MLMLLIIIVVLLAVGIALVRHFDDDEGWWWFGSIIAFISTIGLLVIPLVWIGSYNGYKANIAVYHAISQSIEDARSGNISELERAALTTKIIESNEIIAEAKYWNGTVFGDIVPDEFANLDYLK